MKKVGILTLSGNDNFGNKLQNYAIIYYINKLGFVSETVWITNPFLANKTKQVIRFLKKKINDVFFQHKRKKKFLKFNKKLNIKHNIIFNDDIKKIINNYNYFIVGSDQVWNCYYFDNDTIYFLNCTKKEKNISYSASIGINDIPKNFHKRYINGLKNFNYISVREDRGKEIVEELTGRKDVEVLVDPTMLLTSEEWDKVSNRPKQLDKIKKEKYILNYFLGNLSDSRKKEIEKIAKKYDCHIINILDKKDPFYTCGPSEFLYLEKHAFLICTDSFHSSVFAILYNRPFVIFDRDQEKMRNMNSRIDTLIHKFKLKNRRYNGKNITEDNLNHDYTEAYKILAKERKKSDDFLRKALDIKEGE